MRYEQVNLSWNFATKAIIGLGVHTFIFVGLVLRSAVLSW